MTKPYPCRAARRPAPTEVDPSLAHDEGFQSPANRVSCARGENVNRAGSRNRTRAQGRPLRHRSRPCTLCQRQSCPGRRGIAFHTRARRPPLLRAPRRRRQGVRTNARPKGAQGLAVDQVSEAVAALAIGENTALHQYVSGVHRFRAPRAVGRVAVRDVRASAHHDRQRARRPHTPATRRAPPRRRSRRCAECRTRPSTSASAPHPGRTDVNPPVGREPAPRRQPIWAPAPSPRCGLRLPYDAYLVEVAEKVESLIAGAMVDTAHAPTAALALPHPS